MASNTQAETRGFETEAKQLLHLMIHSLYSNKEIFLRDYALDSIMWIRADNVEIDLRTHPTVTIYEPATV